MLIEIGSEKTVVGWGGAQRGRRRVKHQGYSPKVTIGIQVVFLGQRRVTGSNRRHGGRKETRRRKRPGEDLRLTRKIKESAIGKTTDVPFLRSDQAKKRAAGIELAIQQVGRERRRSRWSCLGRGG